MERLPIYACCPSIGFFVIFRMKGWFEISNVCIACVWLDCLENAIFFEDERKVSVWHRHHVIDGVEEADGNLCSGFFHIGGNDWQIRKEGKRGGQLGLVRRICPSIGGCVVLYSIRLKKGNKANCSIAFFAFKEEFFGRKKGKIEEKKSIGGKYAIAYFI